MMSVSRFCPTSNGNTSFSADLASFISSSGYHSLYDKNRRDFDQLELRKESFVLFPHWSYSKPLELAKAGFHYTGDDDTTKCHSCSLEVSNWKQSDVPMEIHRRKSPNCLFIINLFREIQQQHHDSDSESSDEEEDCIDGFGALGAEQNSDSDCELETDGPPLHQLTLSESDINNAAVAAADCRFTPRNSAWSSSKQHAAPKNFDKAALRQENDKMRSSLTCRVCKVEQIQTLFLPCRHLVMCEKCSEQIDDCVLCKKRILGTVRTFLL